MVFGDFSHAKGIKSSAVGYLSAALGDESSAVGYKNSAYGPHTSAIGAGNGAGVSGSTTVIDSNAVPAASE